MNLTDPYHKAWELIDAAERRSPTGKITDEEVFELAAKVAEGTEPEWWRAQVVADLLESVAGFNREE